MSTLQDLASGAQSAATGDVGGVLKSVLSIFAGHSEYYKFDEAVAAGNWADAATMAKDLYTNPASNDKYGAGLDGYLSGPFSSGAKGKFTGPRASVLPLIYKNTHDAGILDIYKAAVAQGLIPEDTSISLPTPIAVIPGAAAAAAQSNISGLYGATVSTNGALPTDYSKVIIPAVIVVAVIIVLVLIFRKKSK